ncbi:MAG: TonB-dependent receptor plug domain-containing protein, partial [Calditrichia bacterium]|nr:TonB-dependent receptor plug domain-containing protein [Calditrichia bacterium]
MKSATIFLISILLFGCVITPYLYAQPIKKDTLTQKDLFEMSIEELMQVKVITASKKLEKIEDAAGTITVYKQSDINALGYYTLSDLANITAGYSSYSIYGEKVFETRGQKAGSFNNNKHLIFIDGIPVNHARAYKANTEEELPLYFADRVEFLRGPASALYGVSAFFGVINIISPTLKENGTIARSRSSAGTYDGAKRIMANILNKNDNSATKLNIGYFEKRASKNFVGTQNDPLNLYWDDRQCIFINLSRKINKGILDGVSSGAIFMRKNGGLGEHWMHGKFSHQINDLTWSNFISYVKYEKPLKKNLEFKSYIKYNQSKEKGWWAPFNNETFSQYNGEGASFKAYNVIVNNYEGQAEIQWEKDETFNLTAGI